MREKVKEKDVCECGREERGRGGRGRSREEETKLDVGGGGRRRSEWGIWMKEWHLMRRENKRKRDVPRSAVLIALHLKRKK